MRILVTGGAGFIGSHLCECLVRDGHKVVILDLLNDFYSPVLKRENLELVRKAGPVDFVHGDILDEAAVTALIVTRKIEVIVHLAALVGVTPSLDQPLEYQRVNVQGTMVLLEAARRGGVKKFVFGSSSSVYGETKNMPFREDNPELLPVSPYGATKIAAEQMCYVYAHLYHFSAICLRFFTVYGPRQRPDLALCKFVELIEAGQEVPVFGDGSSSRDYTYCDDIVAGIVAAIDYKTGFDIFNLGNAHPVKLLEVIAAIEKVVGRRAQMRRLAERPGDMRATFADISKAERILGYRPATTLDEGLQRLVEWHRDRRLAVAG